MYNLDYEKEAAEFSFLGNYRGEVVENNDPMQAGRCQIRIHSVYDDVPDDCLPWAEYCDPFMQGQNGSGGMFVPDIGAKVWCFFEAGDHMQPVYFGGAPSFSDNPPNKSSAVGDTPRYGVEYTKNRVLTTSAGHTLEFDDTPGDSRVRIGHKSGSQVVMYENGDVYEETMGNHRRYIKGNLQEIIDGSVLRQVSGNQTEIVNGNVESYVKGNSKDAIAGNTDEIVGGNASQTINGSSALGVIGTYDVKANGGVNMQSTSNINVDGAELHFNGGSAGSATAADDFESSAEFDNSPANAAVLIDVAGPKAAWDEEGEAIPANWPAETAKDAVEKPTEIQVEDNNTAPLSADCENITSIDYNYRLSPNFTVGSLTRNAVFSHQLRAQNGLSISQIICNLKHLCINILEPLKAQYPTIRINSGFRAGAGNSQHNKGQAVDIQIPGAPASVYSDVAAWVVRNLNYDQFIFEHGNSVWLHLSFNANGNRKQRMTYYPKRSPQYQAGVLKNYYDSGRVIT